MSQSPSQALAGPSRTPANPSRLKVVHRDTPSTSFASAPTTAPTQLSDQAVLAHSLARQAQSQRRASKWADRLMEQTIDLQTFKAALRYVKSSQYQEILHERHLNGLCSYPTCGNDPSEEYSSARRFRISVAKRSIKEEQGNEAEGFCSSGCRVRGEWVGRELDRKGKGEEVEFLEDMVVGDVPIANDNIEGNSIGRIRTKPSTQSKYTPAVKEEQPTGTFTRLDSGPDLMPNLVIHERPLQPIETVPRPPSSRGSNGLTSDLTITSTVLPLLASTPSDASVKPPTKRSALQSLLPTPQKLASSIVSQSRQMGPAPQLPPDVDEGEEDDPPTGEDLGLDLDWGDGEELDKMFEEMKLGRGIMEEDGGGKA